MRYGFLVRSPPREDILVMPMFLGFMGRAKWKLLEGLVRALGLSFRESLGCHFTLSFLAFPRCIK